MFSDNIKAELKKRGGRPPQSLSNETLEDIVNSAFNKTKSNVDISEMVPTLVNVVGDGQIDTPFMDYVDLYVDRESGKMDPVMSNDIRYFLDDDIILPTADFLYDKRLYSEPEALRYKLNTLVFANSDSQKEDWGDPDTLSVLKIKSVLDSKAKIQQILKNWQTKDNTNNYKISEILGIKPESIGRTASIQSDDAVRDIVSYIEKEKSPGYLATFKNWIDDRSNKTKLLNFMKNTKISGYNKKLLKTKALKEIIDFLDDTM